MRSSLIFILTVFLYRINDKHDSNYNKDNPKDHSFSSPFLLYKWKEMRKRKGMKPLVL
nr:MAG TPA: hypothetical protein [Caudoviricetes sp.]